MEKQKKSYATYNKIKSRQDIVDWMCSMLPDIDNYKELSGVHYESNIRYFEYFSRPLWGIFSYLKSGDFDETIVLPYIKRIKLGLNKNTIYSFPNPTTKTRQIVVEMAVYGFGLLYCQDRLLNYFNDEEKKQLESWLNAVNNIELPIGNWYFFLLIINLGLKKNGMAHNQSRIDEAINTINTLYVGDGWYQDGAHCQRDYYIPFAFHFYSLIIATTLPDGSERQIIYERSTKFYEDFICWFDKQGRSLPYGRSLTYRFAHVAYYAALALQCNVSNDMKELKGMIFRNLRYWIDEPIYNNDNTLSIGYGYPNLIMSEDYNAHGSPAWAFKSFVILALPATHDFWKIEEAKFPLCNKIFAQEHPGFIGVLGNTHTYVLSAKQYSKHQIIQHGNKYGKFCYSTAFGWNVSRDTSGLNNFAIDSALVLSICGTDQYYSRTKIEIGIVKKDYVYSKWKYGEIAKIETWLIPLDEFFHIRIHRIKTNENLECYEGSFPVINWNPKVDKERVANDGILIRKNSQESGIFNIVGYKNHKVITQNPNTNIYSYEKNAVSTLSTCINNCETILGSLVYGNANAKHLLKEIPKVILKDNRVYLENKVIELEEF